MLPLLLNGKRMIPMGRLQGRNAIVTGAALGLGAGIAEALAAEGACVASESRRLLKRYWLRPSLYI